MLTAAALIGKGYFPRELPPPFTTVPLSNAPDRTPPPGRRPWTECARHNLARVDGFRRPLKIPNPRSFTELATTIETLWPLLNLHLKSSHLSISGPVATRTLERALRPRFRFGEKPKFRARDWAGQRFVLQSDVSQFYASVYTHSIAWALHGKSHAKANIGKTDGDRLDKALRAGSGGQTVGIPIGPDTSFLMAEVVLTAVDSALAAAIPDLRGFRYLDDYELAFRSRSQAEEAQVLLEAALADYELAINPAKTSILELPEPFQDQWPHELLTFPIRDRPIQAANDLVALFSRAADLAKPSPGALKYALLRSRDVTLTKEFWRTFQHLVWASVSAEPTTTATALDLLLMKSQEVGEELDAGEAADVLGGLVLVNAPVRNSSEVVWALWAATALNVELSAAAAAAVSDVEDDFVALLALHGEAVGTLPPASLDRSRWENLVDHDDVMTGPHWLLAYEGAAHGWLPAAAKRVAKDAFFKKLAVQDVRFLDPEATRAPFTGSAGPLPGGQVPEDYL